MGTTTAPASIIIPACATPTNKARIVIYGHGFFGGLDESMGGYVRQFAEVDLQRGVGGCGAGCPRPRSPPRVLALNDAEPMPGFDRASGRAWSTS